MDERFGDDCLLGLADFSHVDVLFLFDQTTERPDYRSRRPRGRTDLPEVDVFADRGRRRPNRNSNPLTFGSRNGPVGS
ncbi:hypothetical protein AB0M80_35195 [Amycolatopsis sp. NPDC051045]|uniref:hypothetical protein n=1 Tax=Amycolatopsis sp. NPDC051045 TaxID=3156922 RepID=UPI00343103B8